MGVTYSLVLSRALPVSQAAVQPDSSNPWLVAAALFRGRCYAAMCLAFFAFCSMLWVFYAWLPNHLVERFGLSMTDSGLRATLFVQLSCAAGVVTGGFLADKLSPKFAPSRYYTAAAGIMLSAPDRKSVV